MVRIASPPRLDLLPSLRYSIYSPQVAQATGRARWIRPLRSPPASPGSAPVAGPTRPPATRIVPVQCALREPPFRRPSSRRQGGSRRAHWTGTIRVAESYQSNALSASHLFAGLLPGDNPSCDQSGNLLEHHFPGIRREREHILFVLRRRPFSHGCQKFPWAVFHLGNCSRSRRTVDMDV